MPGSQTAEQDFDAVLLEIGEFGLYQKLVLSLLVVTGSFMNAYNRYQSLFLLYTPTHLCEHPLIKNFQYSNITAEKCEIHYFSENITNRTQAGKCEYWTFDKEYFESTVITKWNLVCNKAIDAKNILSLFMIATVLGCAVFSFIMDHWGRKVAFNLSVATYIFGSTTAVLMPNLVAFTILHMCSAINRLASFNISYIWALEYIGPSKRTVVSAVMSSGMYGIGLTSLALIAWVSRTWVVLSIATSLPFILVFSYPFIIMESPRWLLSQGRTDEAREVVVKILKWDRKEVDLIRIEELLIKLSNGGTNPGQQQPRAELTNVAKSQPHSNAAVESVKGFSPSPAKVSRKGRIIHLFQGPTLRKKTLLLLWTWVASTVVWAGLSFNAENLGGNFYITWSLLSLAESAASIFIIAVNKIGRIWSCSAFFILSGVLCLASAPSAYVSTSIVIIFALIGKMCITVSYCLVYQITSELMPTPVRGIGVGFGSIVGDCGNILMPYIIYSAVVYKMMPMVILGIVALSAGIVVLFLPETADHIMPETLEQAEESGRDSWKTFLGHFKRIFQSSRIHATPSQPSTSQAVSEQTV